MGQTPGTWTGAILRKLHHARTIFDSVNGINLKAGEWLHNTILIPKITYGSLVWASHDLTQKEEDILLEE